MENMNTVDYSRQEAMTNVLSNGLPLTSTNIIIGCGGIGYWLGIFLAMLGYKNFILIDGDNLDHSNLNRIPVPQTWVGANKAIALRRTIRAFRPDTKILTLSSHITEDTFGILDELAGSIRHASYMNPNIRNKNTIWDTTDNAHIQKKIWKKANETNQYQYRKLGYEAFDIGCYANMDVWTADDYTAGYRTTNANAITSALSAGLGIFARALSQKDFSTNIRNLILNSDSQQGETLDKEKLLEAIHDFDFCEADDEMLIEFLSDTGVL